MRDAKDKWIRFEDGLFGENGCIDSEAANQNKEAYGKFCERFCDGADRKKHVVLIFFGKRLWGGRKKRSRKNIGDPMARTLLMSISESCSSDASGASCTVLKVGYEEPFVLNAIGSTKERTVQCIGLKWWIKSVLNVKSAVQDISKFTKKSLWILILALLRVMLKDDMAAVLHWMARVISVIQEWIKAIADIAGIAVVIAIIDRLWPRICIKVADAVKEDVQNFRDSGLPAIFYDGTGKDVAWINEYIKCYIGECGQKDPARQAVYIGSGRLGGETDGVVGFIVPKKYPNWGLVCLCKLVRDLAGSPWGKLKLSSDIIGELSKGDGLLKSGMGNFRAELRKAVFLEGRVTMRKFYISEEEDLKKRLREKEASYWSFCINPPINLNAVSSGRDSDKSGQLVPIGRTVYVIHGLSEEETRCKITALQDIMSAQPHVFVLGEFMESEIWSIQISGEEQRIIGDLDEIMKRPSWDGHSGIWDNIWKGIVAKLHSGSEKGWLIKELCREVWDEKKVGNYISFEEFYEKATRAGITPRILRNSQ